MILYKCLYCGNRMASENPIEYCKLCRSDRIVPLERLPANAVPEENAFSIFYERITLLTLKHYLHVVFVPFPFAIVPLSFFLNLLGTFTRSDAVSIAAQVNLIIVAILMPLALFFGHVEWKYRYHESLRNLFIVKMFCGGFVWVFMLVLICWRQLYPAVLHSSYNVLFIIIHLSMAVAVLLAAHLGRRLVYREGMTRSMHDLPNASPKRQGNGSIPNQEIKSDGKQSI